MDHPPPSYRVTIAGGWRRPHDRVGAWDAGRAAGGGLGGRVGDRPAGAPAAERLAFGVLGLVGLAWVTMLQGPAHVGLLGRPWALRAIALALVAGLLAWRRPSLRPGRIAWAPVAVATATTALVAWPGLFAATPRLWPSHGDMLWHQGWIRQLAAGVAAPGGVYAGEPNSYPWLYHSIAAWIMSALPGDLNAALLALGIAGVAAGWLGLWLLARELGAPPAGGHLGRRAVHGRGRLRLDLAAHPRRAHAPERREPRALPRRPRALQRLHAVARRRAPADPARALGVPGAAGAVAARARSGCRAQPTALGGGGGGRVRVPDRAGGGRVLRRLGARVGDQGAQPRRLAGAAGRGGGRGGVDRAARARLPPLRRVRLDHPPHARQSVAGADRDRARRPAARWALPGCSRSRAGRAACRAR